MLYSQDIFKIFKIIKSIVNTLSTEKEKTISSITYDNHGYINNQFLGSPLFYQQKIVGILREYKNQEINKSASNRTKFYIFTQEDIDKIREVVKNKE